MTLLHKFSSLIRFFLYLFPGLFLMAFVIPAFAAQDGLIFILDGSGSMWGRIGQDPKITIAKTVMVDLVAQAPQNLDLGLMVYGHRRKGDCNDIEAVAKLGSSKSDLTRAVSVIMPKGKTPLAQSLTMAGEFLHNREESTTLVLVSDGIETCAGNPCDVAKKLRDQGHKIIIHTVGFDVSSNAASQLNCIAEAGGGKFFQVDDSASLQKALQTVQTAVVDKTEIIEEVEDKVKVADIGQTGEAKSKKIQIAGPGKVRLKYASWVQPPKYWKLVEAETAEEQARSKSNEARVKEGEYQVTWRQADHGYDDVPLTAVVSVKSGETSELAIDTGIELLIPQEIQQPKWWGLGEPGKTRPQFSFAKGLGPHVVPAGSYELLWRQSEHNNNTTALGKVSIESGKLNKIVADTSIYVQPAEWMTNKEPHYFRILDEKNTIKGSWNVLRPQLAPHGKFQLVYRPTQHGHNQISWGEVTINEHGVTTVPLDSGVIFLHQEDAKPPYRIFFVNLSTKKEIVIKSNWDPVPIPPGKYRIDWWDTQHGSNRQLLVEEVSIEAGSVLELEL